ncbi:aryl hydrocarbon receptor-like [Solea senegalensis]|uniref:Aryl hydrocarbon receptor-like n=2 Tax=Solea senegalensis TaxID=28829 RepID=A0AAV6R241_SOLSE|nr:aryl hydrocarbon receptor-like [Solea senegalensis]KAG7498540.1 aryl hydrocarbon receptor-like [Solea senegalensis]
MQGNGGVYAVKNRRKPLQKNVKPPPVKTNPSKRHRDRLNVELDHLTSLLPFSEEVRGRLDKLSVLRLSVGYLKAQSYFHATPSANVKSAPANGKNGETMSLDGVGFSEGEFLLQALNGFVLVVTTTGVIFYASPTILDFLGFHQSDVLHQRVYDLVHVDDREMFKCQLHFALNPGEDGQSGCKSLCSSQSFLPQYLPPENSSFLERSFCCRLRCLKDNTSGFLALNFNGRLKYLHLQGGTGADGNAAPPQLALFAIATPVQSPSVMEIRTKTIIFQTKHRMDFAPLGIDTRGKLVLGYTEVELVTTGSGYQFIHAGDMMYCADNHLRMMKTGDSGFTFFRLLTKTRQWLWVQASARLVFKDGRPDFIIARQKALTNEEGEEHLRQRRQQLPFNVATGEGVLYDFSLDVFSTDGPSGSDAPGTSESAPEKPLDPASLLGSLRRQDHSVYMQPERPSPQLPVFSQTEDTDYEQTQPSLEQAFLDSHALLSVPGEGQALQKRLSTVDLTSDAMIESLEQILGDFGDGGIEGFDVDEIELRDWENTLIRMNKEREDAERELNRTLANDVFTYVEEALQRESSGFVIQRSDVAGCNVSGMINNLSIQGENHGFVDNEPQWQQMMDITSTQTIFGGEGNILADVFNSTAQKDASKISHGTISSLTPTQCFNTQQGHTSSLWPPRSSSSSSSNHNCSSDLISTQPWLPATRNANNIPSSFEMMDQGVQYSLTHTGAQQTSVGPQRSQPQGLSEWQHQQQQQQLPPQTFHHTFSHSSNTAVNVNSAAHPHTQTFSGSCMYENRDGRARPRLGPAFSSGATRSAENPANTAAAITLPHLDVTVSGSQHGAVSSSSSHTVSGNNANVGMNLPGYSTANGSLQPPFVCWNSEAQTPRVPLNGGVDPFAFPVRPPAGSINLSKNMGPS